MVLKQLIHNESNIIFSIKNTNYNDSYCLGKPFDTEEKIKFAITKNILREEIISKILSNC